MKKAQILMNKSAYLGLSILDLSKTVIDEFWYDYVKPEYGEKAKLCYMNTDTFIVLEKTNDIAKDGEKRFDTSNFEIDRPLPKETNNKLIGLMRGKLGGQIMKEFVGLRAKTYSYLKENNDEDKKAKGTKKYVIKRKPLFQDYKNCLRAAKIENKIVYYLDKKKINVDCFKEDQKEFLKK